ncbi:hypothetical protein DEJ27_12145 [Curtobacterium sp. MCPF17_018]|uniref:hypothetical protein n=1 Tax=Curtobacterium sp. MCPF17_018 TaxID=2175638 RepID=UPI000DA752B0|nr:hypothetical protein [Curtobacterium sp. MCPF17_018]PZE67368.1 hypothetical protein DEJ27_12145 [Curtobacterium sp. MCPF17_018]
MNLAVLGLLSATNSQPEVGGAEAAPEQTLRALLEALHGDQETSMAVYGEVAGLLEGRVAVGGAMTAEQARVLVESGSMTAEELAENEAEVARGELEISEYRTALEPIVASCGPRAVAELLKIDGADVAQLAVKGQLYAFSSGSLLRFPTWQFVDGDRADQRTVPGLADLVAGIPRSMHPASVLGFMHTPQDDLRVHGDRVTPLRWLKDGGDVQDVIDILPERDRS